MPITPVVHLEMSISLSEFMRSLNYLPGESELFSHANDMTWELCTANGGVCIACHELPPRRVGALTLPRARVTLDMHHLPPGRRDAFLRRFRRAFQRGGG